MSVLLKRALLVGVTLLLCACDSKPVPDTPENDSAAGKLLRGDHQLLPITKYTEIASGYSGKYFLIQSHPSTPSVFHVSFAWRTKSDNITFTELPLSIVSVDYDDTVKVPSIRFRWRRSTGTTRPSDINWMVEQFVRYAVITCTQDDWPTTLNYPPPIYRKHEDP